MLTSVLLAVSFAVAQVDEPKVAQEHLKPLESLIGDWLCEGEVEQDIGNIPKGTKFDFKASYKWILNKNAILLKWSVTLKGLDMPPYEGTELIGWDGKNAKIVRGGFIGQGESTHAEYIREDNIIRVPTRIQAVDGGQSSYLGIIELVDGDEHTWKQIQQKDKDGNDRPDTPVSHFRRVK